MNSQKSPQKIQDLFTLIAPTYDLLNHLFSFGMDILWRKACGVHLGKRGDWGIDLCGGTGDMSFFCEDRADRWVLTDFSLSMLQIAKKKTLPEHLYFVCCDATALPFRDAVFDKAVTAFGIRNVEIPSNAIKEAERILRVRGVLCILEFFSPRNNLRRKIFNIYLTKIMPLLGRLVSRHPFAYHYLADSIEHFFSFDEFLSFFPKAVWDVEWRHHFFLGISSALCVRKISP